MFPEEIVQFPIMEDVSASDGQLISAYQQAMQNQNLEEAEAILHQIPNYDKKIITANFLNQLTKLATELQVFYLDRYSPAYIVSSTQPSTQGKYDFWFEITGNA